MECVYIKENGATKKIIDKELNNRGMQLYRFHSIDALKDVPSSRVSDKSYVDIENIIHQIQKDNYDLYIELIEVLINKIVNLKSTDELYLDEDSILNIIMSTYINDKRSVESKRKASRIGQYQSLITEIKYNIKLSDNAISIMDGIVKNIIKRYVKYQVDCMSDVEITNIHRFIIEGRDPLSFICINNKYLTDYTDETLKTLIRSLMIVLINTKYETRSVHLCFDCKYPMTKCTKMMEDWKTIDQYDYITDGKQIIHDQEITNSWVDNEGKTIEETVQGEVIDKFTVSKCKNYIK